MKIKEQTRKLVAGCSKHCFEVVDRTDEVSSKHGFEVVDETDEVSNHTYGKATLTWFEEIFEEYQSIMKVLPLSYPLYKKPITQALKLDMIGFYIFLNVLCGYALCLCEQLLLLVHQQR